MQKPHFRLPLSTRLFSLVSPRSTGGLMQNSEEPSQLFAEARALPGLPLLQAGPAGPQYGLLAYLLAETFQARQIVEKPWRTFCGAACHDALPLCLWPPAVDRNHRPRGFLSGFAALLCLPAVCDLQLWRQVPKTLPRCSLAGYLPWTLFFPGGLVLCSSDELALAAAAHGCPSQAPSVQTITCIQTSAMCRTSVKAG